MDFFNNIFNFVYIPFGLIFKLIYSLVENYGLTIIIFAILSKVAMLPLGIKNEKSRIKMQLIQPKLQEIQKKYKKETSNPKMQEEMQKVYADNGTSMYGGCGWQFLQLPIIWAIWNAIRNPISYIWDVADTSKIVSIATKLFNNGVDLGIKVGADQTVTSAITSWISTHQISLAGAVSSNMEFVENILPSGYRNIDFTFLGLDLGAMPAWTSLTLLIPFISGITSFLVGFVSQKLMTKKHSTIDGPAKKNMNTLLYIMPIISIVIGFSFNIAIGLYWILSNILSIAQTFFVYWYVDKKEKKDAPAVVVKEKKINYNQIEKMERDNNDSASDK